MQNLTIYYLWISTHVYAYICNVYIICAPPKVMNVKFREVVSSGEEILRGSTVPVCYYFF